LNNDLKFPYKSKFSLIHFRKKLVAMRSAFNMHHSDLQNFLFAPVWDEKNGTTLSILSALARLDMDPWREAARLADMPRSVAATTLASILARLPGDNLKLSDSATLSQRLVEFLPEGRSNAGTETTGVGNSDDNGGSWRNIAVGVALAAILVISQMNGWLF
jgi:hypothetical protein